MNDEVVALLKQIKENTDLTYMVNDIESRLGNIEYLLEQQNDLIRGFYSED
ncbi:hypothetical protein [Corynebacterium deserti]|uniref:hypothetical protein n=1 Tax=Corynebacterium deserti TaxID=1408191 RepID=UPI000B1F8A9B|nr:hypothetical protein [Corynebacterium deserti]